MVDAVVEKIVATLGSDKVKVDEETLDARRHDWWLVQQVRDHLGEKGPRPSCVVQPTSVEDVQALVRLANQEGFPLVPFGLGSGVCGGMLANETSIVLDMSNMKSVRFIDETNMLASFDAGLRGTTAEEAVAEKGLTIGHWPQSIALSSVGGWISTRASGQFSTAYGNIEDIVFSVEAVLPDGELVTFGKAPRSALGPDLRHLLMGAEGTMGIVTGVTLQLRRQSEKRAFSTWYAQTMDQGFEVQRQIMHAEWRPPVMRQYDLPEVQRSFPDYVEGDKCILIMVHEGPASRVEAELAAVRDIALAGGLTEGNPAAAEGWLDHRNHVPDPADLFNMNVMFDTIEVSATWDRIGQVYRDAIEALGTVQGIVNASAHSSHAYQTGLNLYFTFAAIREGGLADMEGAYFDSWEKVVRATSAAGGGIAHHHGAGRVRKPFVDLDLGDAGVEALRKLKKAFDPNGILNPGNLIPD